MAIEGIKKFTWSGEITFLQEEHKRYSWFGEDPSHCVGMLNKAEKQFNQLYDTDYLKELRDKAKGNKHNLDQLRGRE